MIGKKRVFIIVIISLLMLFASCTKKEKKVSVVFDCGDNITNTITIAYDDVINEPKDPVKEGYKFLYWEYNGAKYNFNTSATENITLVAKWEKMKYKVVINDGEIQSFDIEYGTSLKDIIKVPEKEGFIGFKNAFSTTDELYDLSKEVKEDLYLISVWEDANLEIEFVKVTFNTNGGSSINPIQIQKDNEVLDVSKYKPTKKDCTFIGWYLDKDFNELLPNDYVLESDITLYAKWSDSGDYVAKLQPGMQVDGWQGKGMEVKIMVPQAYLFDPFNSRYSLSDQKVRQKQELLVEAAYDIKISYVEWGNEAAWGPDRIQYIKDNINSGFRDNDVYIIQINSSWIPTLVNNSCLAPLYNMKEDSGIFTEIGYQETEKGSGVYVLGQYEQDTDYNYATSYDNVVYGYVTGKARPDYFMYYNVDLINEANLEDPAEMWFKGEWTWSNFEKYATQLQAYLTTKSTSESTYKALAMGYTEFFIGSCASTGKQITNVSPASLYLNNQSVIDQLGAIQKIVNSGNYDKTRGLGDVARSFAEGLSAFDHGNLWFLKEPSRFNPSWSFEIGCVPYPTADGQGGEPILTDNPDEAIYTSSGQPLTNANGQYIKGVDMSMSSFRVPFTKTSCYSVVNTPSGKNGINNKIIFAIMYDLFEGQGVNPNSDQTEDEAYRNFLAQKKFNSDIYADVILSVQDCLYFELIEMVSMSVGASSQTLWMTIPNICTRDTMSPSDGLNSIYEIHCSKMREMGYMVP